MALSNWALMAINEKGEPVRGRFVSPSGVLVDIYKNWIYVDDEKVWTEEGDSFKKPTVMSVRAGTVDYKDVKMRILRGPQEGVYAVIWAGYGNPLGMIGCGVYGYGADGEFVGVLKTSLEWFEARLKHDFDDVPLSLRRVTFGKAGHFNQSDAYLAAELGVPPPPATPMGEAPPPFVLIKLLDQEKPR